MGKHQKTYSKKLFIYFFQNFLEIKKFFFWDQN